MSYYGDLDPGDILDLKFTTMQATGAPITLAAPTLVVFKDNAAACDTSGVTLTVDFGGRTGLHHARIDTAACGTFYSAGSNFAIVLSAGTVDSISVAGYGVGAFSVQARSALRPTTAGQTLDVTADGQAGIDWANVGNPTTSVGLTGTTIKTATDVEAKLPAALVDGAMAAALTRTACEPTSVFTWGVSTFEDVLTWLGVRASNTQTQTATTTTVRNRANDCDIATSTSSDNGTTATRGSFS